MNTGCEGYHCIHENAMGSRYRKDFLKHEPPETYISRDSLDEETVAFDVWEWFYEDKPWVAERIQRLEYDIKMLSTMSPYAAIQLYRRGLAMMNSVWSMQITAE